MPSWTDRIFYYAKSNAGVQLISYGRFESLLSDHMPVSAYFLVKPAQAKLLPPPPTHLLRASVGANFTVPVLPPNKLPPTAPVTSPVAKPNPVATTTTTANKTLPPRKPLPSLPPATKAQQPTQSDLLDFSDFTSTSTTTTTTSTIATNNHVRNSVSQMPSLKHIKLSDQKRNTIGAAPTSTKFNPFDDGNPFAAAAPKATKASNNNNNPFDSPAPQNNASQGSVKNMISKFNTKQ